MANIQKNYIPVALKAGLVNNPPQGIEGKLYAEINRTKAAPQGICVMNSAGKVLDWALSFDSDESVTEFFQYAVDRFKQFPDAAQPVETRRYHQYPGNPMQNVADSGMQPEITDRHVEDHCPAIPKKPVGTFVGKVIGRPTDEQGNPIETTLHQEEYLEATFDVPRSTQQEFVQALRDSSGNRFRVPDSFVRAIVGPAYLGQLDVSPLQRVPTGINTESWWEFHAEPVVQESGDTVRLRITGRSHIAGAGHQWDHAVSLGWQGYVEIDDNLVSQLHILAEGHETLHWHVGNLVLVTEPACATLMGGHPIDLDSPVVYGLSGTRSANN